MCDKSNATCKKQRKITEMLQNTKKSKNGKGTLNKRTAISAATPNISPQLPVSLKFFKTHTEYDEVIDKLLWASVKGNEDEYKTIKDDVTMRENILLDYYKAFYMEPDIREEYPIRLKAMPKHLKDKLLRLPYGQQGNVQDSVASDDSELVTEEEDEQQQQEVEGGKQAIEGEDKYILLDNVNNKCPRGTKRLYINNNNNDQNEQPHKRQKVDKKANIALRSTSIKDLEMYEHCCPITYKQFKEFTNVLSLMVEKFVTEPKKRWPYFLKKTYLLFYLKPEVRSKLPFKNIQIKSNATCPREIKEKLYIIPEIYGKNCESFDVNAEQFKEKENCVETSFGKCNDTQENCNDTQENCNGDEVKEATRTTKLISNKMNNISEGKTLEILECRVLPPITFREDNSESLSRLAESVAHVKPMQREMNTNYINSSNAQRNSARFLQENDGQHLVGVITNSQSEHLGHSSIVMEQQQQSQQQHQSQQQQQPQSQQQQQSSTDNNCIFCHFTLDDFMTCTNILQVLAKNFNNLTELDRKVRLFYINFLTERLEPEEMSSITISLAKVNVLKKYRHICLNCLNAHQLPLSQPLNIGTTPANSQRIEISSRFREISNNESQTTLINAQINEMNEPLQSSSATGENQMNDQHDEEIQLKVPKEKKKEGESVTCESEGEPATRITTDAVDNVLEQVSPCVSSDFNLVPPDKLSKNLLSQIECVKNGKPSSKCNGDKNDHSYKFIQSLRCQLKITIRTLWKCVHYLPVNYDTFKQWSEYEEPLLSIIKKVAANNSRIVQTIQNDIEICELLLQKYYVRYFTSESIRRKYPLKLKLCPPDIQEKMFKYIKEQNDNKEEEADAEDEDKTEQQQTFEELDKCKEKLTMDDDVVTLKSFNTITTTRPIKTSKFYSGIFSDVFLLNVIAVKCVDPLKQHTVLQHIKQHFPNLTQNSKNVLQEQEKQPEINEQQKHLPKDNRSTINMRDLDLLFSQLDKTHTLTYVLRTRHGLKHDIICCILEMTFEEFYKLIHIYEADHLKTNLLMVKYLYNCAINGNSNSEAEAKIWPINLYIKLHDILGYLKKRNIHLSSNDDKYILKYISPKFLHWTDLLQTTNFLSSVSKYFMKKNGIKLDLEDMVLVYNASQDYYTCCWKYDEWIWQIPTINDQEMSYTNSDGYFVTNAQQHQQNQVASFSSFPSLTSDQLQNNHGESNALEKSVLLSREEISKLLPSNTKMEKEIESNKEFIEDRHDTESNLKESEGSVMIEERKSLEKKAESIEEKRTRTSPLIELNLGHCRDDGEENEEVVRNKGEECGLTSRPTANLHLENVSQLGNNENDCNFITVLNTQQQLHLLPNEVTLRHDPLDEFAVEITELDNIGNQSDQDNKKNFYNNTIKQDDIDTEPAIIAIADEDEANIHIKSEAMLNNLLFYLDESNDVIHCSPISEEVVVLDDTEMENDLDLNNIECSNTEKTTATMLTNTFNENIINSNAVEKNVENSLISSTLDHNYAEVDNEKGHCNEVNQMNVQLFHQQHYQTNQYRKDLQNIGNDAENTAGIYVASQQPLLPQVSNPSCTGKQIKNVSNTKRTFSHNKLKKTQKIGPLGKSGELVPQLNHDFRSLPVQRIVKPNSKTALSTLANDGNDNNEIAGRLSYGARGSTVSQELETDCTIFNNSALTKITNCQNNEVNLTKTRIAQSQIDDSINNRTRYCDPMATSHMNQHLTTNESNIMTSQINQVLTTGVNQCSYNIVTNPLPVALLTSTSHSSQVIIAKTHNEQFIVKPILHRTLLQFDYFIELTPQQIVRYTLDTNEVGNIYYQAGIRCDGLELYITKDVFTILFPYWSSSLQKDVLNLLKDLKEYHYTIRQSSPNHDINQTEDLRIRILNFLFKTAPSISHICLSYDVNNPEKGFYSNMTNRNRLPHANLMKAIKSNVLHKMHGFLNRDNKN